LGNFAIFLTPIAEEYCHEFSGDGVGLASKPLRSAFMKKILGMAVLLVSGVAFARPPDFDPTGIWNTAYLGCYGRTDYAGASEPVVGTTFDCKDYEIDLQETGPVFVLYNEDTELVTISGGIRKDSSATFALNNNLVGWSRWAEVESEERVPGCTVTTNFSDGIVLNSENSIRYLVSFDYEYSPGCDSYLQEVGKNLGQGTSSLLLLRALYGTDGIDLDRITELTNARLTTQYRGTNANVPSEGNGELAGEAAPTEGNPQNPERPI
jgi:hypothetical protein